MPGGEWPLVGPYSWSVAEIPSVDTIHQLYEERAGTRVGHFKCIPFANLQTNSGEGTLRPYQHPFLRVSPSSSHRAPLKGRGGGVLCPPPPLQWC